MFELAHYNHQQHRQLPLKPGRYLIGSEHPNDGDTMPVVINDPWLCAQQAQLTLRDDYSVSLKNLGRPILLPNGRRIKTGLEMTLSLPASFTIGKTRFALHSSDVTCLGDDTLRSLASPLAQAHFEANSSCKLDPTLELRHAAPAADTLVHWFDALNQLQQIAIGTQQSFENAVQSLLDPGGLDLALMLVKQGERWEIAASHIPFPEFGISFRRDIVERSVEQQCVWFHLGGEPQQIIDAAIPHWVITAPIFGAHKKVEAILYGARFENPHNHRHGIRPLEAHFVRMVADSLSAAWQRRVAETEAARSQVVLQQTFSPQVVEVLRRDPQLLQSRETEVSVLFADIRNFTGITEKLGASLTHQLLGDLFNRLITVIEERDGVVIDIYGDGLAAFWNAPLPVPDHPIQACDAAIHLQNALSVLNQQWAETSHQPLQMGIGLHTGQAMIGNSGCDRKIKYGPRGTVVNIAARLEAATRFYRVPILVSGTMASRLPQHVKRLRLCQTHLPGLDQSLDIYQLLGAGAAAESCEFAAQYEAALQAFETRAWSQCLEVLLELHQHHAHDPRIDFLLSELEQHIDRKSHKTFPGFTSPERRSGKIDATDDSRSPFRAQLKDA